MIEAKRSSSLKAEILPYITISAFRRQSFQDVTGIFFTTPEYRPSRKIGLDKNQSFEYIDFTLHPGTGVLKLEEGIYLVPGQKAFPDWILERYSQFQKLHYLPQAETSLLETFQHFDQLGFIPEPVQIPIIIQD